MTIFASPCPPWSSEQAGKKLSELQKEIDYHNQLYFSHNKYEILDAEFDQMQQYLANLKSCFPSIASESFTLLKDKGLQKKHHTTMGSLNKANDEQSIRRFLAKVDGQALILQPKIDGIAIELVYDRGVLTSAITRGDGSKGRSILKQIKEVSAIPKQLNQKGKIVLHGELFVQLSKLKEQDRSYTSARHFVAAHIHRKATDKDAMDKLDFFPWKWINSPHKTEQKNSELLANEGFLWPSRYTYVVSSLQEILALKQALYQPDTPLPFLMDGIVIKLDDIKIRAQWGGNQTAPHWALAWKFPAMTAITTIKDITFSIGRTGKITPIVKVVPSEILERTISSISLGSLASLKEKSLSVGDHIVIELTGQATPEFKRVLIRNPKGRNPNIPDQELYNSFSCLSLSSQCYQQFVARLHWLVGSRGLDLPYLTKANLSTLIDAGHIKSLDQFFKLSIEDFTDAGLLKNQAGELKKAIVNASILPFEQRLIACSVPNIGKQKARLLASYYSNFGNLKKASAQELALKINSSEMFSHKLLAFLKLPEMNKLIAHLTQEKD